MEMVTVSFAEKCGTARARSLCGPLTEKLSVMPSVRLLNILSVGMVGSSGSLGSAVLSEADSPRVSTKTPPMGNLVDTLSIAKGGILASNCLESAMHGICPCSGMCEPLMSPCISI